MPWAVQLGDQQFRLSDLTVREMLDLAAKHGMSDVATAIKIAPLHDPAIAEALVRVAAHHLGLDGEVEQFFAQPVDALFDAFVEVGGDLPEEVEDGVPLEGGGGSIPG